MTLGPIRITTTTDENSVHFWYRRPDGSDPLAVASFNKSLLEADRKLFDDVVEAFKASVSRVTERITGQKVEHFVDMRSPEMN